METVKNIKREEKEYLKESEWNLRSMIADHKTAVERLAESKRENIAHFSGRLVDCKKLGGLITKHEAIRYLGISRQRFEFYVRQNRFRTLDFFFSLADIKIQKKKKAGRPASKKQHKMVAPADPDRRRGCNH